MSTFRIGRITGLPAAECWSRVTDWPAHGAAVPLTAVTVSGPGPAGVGTTVVARSGAGTFGFDDPMEIVEWEPPSEVRRGRCRLEKRGRVVTGWAEIEVHGTETGSVVLWIEELRVALLPRRLDRVVARVGRLVFARALDALLYGRDRH
ncbi:SRPBCC family protein [Streptomyces pristinaespiralis]|uniref:SRPBCC family protein n=1 Tax=Streptomyces pristinaespiralis TaxID=38300 RepID=UPI0037A1486B